MKHTFEQPWSMKMRNRLFSRSLVATVAVVSLAACTSESQDDSTNAPVPPTAATSPTIDAAAPATSADASSEPTSTEPSSTATQPDSAASSDQERPADDRADVTNALAALDTAAAEVPDGQPFDLERDDHDGAEVWEIKVESNGDEYKLLVSFDGGTVVTSEKEDSPDDDVAKVQQATVTAADALRTAAEAQPGELDEMEIDTDRDGTLRWEVEFDLPDGAEVEVSVDASSGEVIQ